MAKQPTYSQIKRAVKNMLSKHNNIMHAEFVTNWPNGRPYKHGAMQLQFQYQPVSRLAAEGDIELFMMDNGYKRSEHYHIPDWNFPYAQRGAIEYVPIYYYNVHNRRTICDG